MCYCLNPTGILHSKTYLYCGTNQVLNASENDLILYVCFSIKSESFYILTERPNILLLHGCFSFLGSLYWHHPVKETSKQHLERPFWSLWAKMYIKCFYYIWKQMQPLCFKVWAAPRMSACLAFWEWDDSTVFFQLHGVHESLTHCLCIYSIVLGIFFQSIFKMSLITFFWLKKFIFISNIWKIQKHK